MLCNKNRKEAGAALVEMGLLVSLIAVVCIVAVRDSGKQTRCKLLGAHVGLNHSNPATNYFEYISSGGCLFGAGGSPGADAFGALVPHVTSSCTNPAFEACFS